MAKYYLGKLNINENIFSKDVNKIKMELIPKKILSFENDDKFYVVAHKTQDDNQTMWTFSDVEHMSQDIILGNIARQNQTERIEIQNGKSIKHNESNAKLVHFYYLISKELLLIQSNSEINYKDSIIIFKQLLLLNDQLHTIGDIEINIISNQNEAIKNLLNNPVRRIELKYIVPNDPKTLNSISDTLLDARAKRGTISMENKDGLKANDNGKLSKVFSNIVSIVDKGFGSWTAKIGNKNHPQTISSNRYPITKNIPKGKIKTNNDVKKIIEEMRNHAKGESKL